MPFITSVDLFHNFKRSFDFLWKSQVRYSFFKFLLILHSQNHDRQHVDYLRLIISGELLNDLGIVIAYFLILYCR
jgi:hypothetical protein